jgi:putative endonuclease
VGRPDAFDRGPQMIDGGISRNKKDLYVISTKGEIFLPGYGTNLMVNERRYYVYLLTNWNNRVIYVGVTNDLMRRIYEHKNKLVEGFTKKYNIHKLVYFEETNDVNSALAREKEIKKWRREKKNNLVSAMNPHWNDLSEN